MSLWMELRLRFDELMKKGDSGPVNQILRFAAWCISPESGRLPNDTSTAVAVAFYEHLPQNRDYWRYFPQWFPKREFNELLAVFGYHLNQQDIYELSKLYWRET